MTELRRIQACKWTGSALAVVLLSATFSRWNAFKAAPGALTYAGILLALTALLALLASLAVVVYAEERARGRLNRPRPRLERWANRFFPRHEPESR